MACITDGLADLLDSQAAGGRLLQDRFGRNRRIAAASTFNR
jgi:hypothetical protein